MPDFKTADLADRLGDGARSCIVQFRRFGKRRRFCGPIETVETHEDAGLAIRCLESPGHGKVLVVDGGASLRVALIGDRMCRLAIENGWAGLVVHGAVRDVAEIDALDIGLLALGTAPVRGSKAGAGRRDVHVRFGGVDFRPGDWVYCDDDGLLVVGHPVQG